MTNTIRYNNSDRGPSTNVWNGQPPMTGQFWQDPSKGWGFFDDFLDVYATANKYAIIEAGTSGSYGMLTTEVGGVARLVTGTQDNDEASISPGIDAGIVKINDGTGIVCCEARIRMSSIADNALAVFFGLVEEGWSAAGALTNDTGVPVDKDCVGFSKVHTDGDAMTVVHNTAGGGGITTLISSVLVPAADTWYKLGLRFDGQSKVTFYVDGVANATTVLESATNFPDGEEMHLGLAGINGAANTMSLDIDWWAVAQESV